jgi:hypothetical protein
MPTFERRRFSGYFGVEDVLAVQQHFAARLELGVQRVDAVEDAQQRRLAAAGGPISAVTRFSAISKLMFFSAWNLP